MSDLFYVPKSPLLEKRAGEVELPDDANLWPQKILDELYSQAMYIADYDPRVEMTRVNSERGYGVGHVEVRNKTALKATTPDSELEQVGIRRVRLPFVIKDRMLSPFDLLLNDESKIMPLTEKRLRRALFRPTAFDVASGAPGDQSLVADLYPPQRQDFGGVGQGSVTDDLSAFGKYGSLMGLSATQQKVAQYAPRIPSAPRTHDSVLDAVLSTSTPEQIAGFAKQAMTHFDYVCTQAENVPAVVRAVERILQAPGVKLASDEDILRSIKPDTLQIQRVHSDLYRVKTANHRAYAPQTAYMTRAEVVKTASAKIAMAVDSTGSVTMSDGQSNGDEQSLNLEPIRDAGYYKVKAADGRELVGYVIPNLVDANAEPVPLALFTNGSETAFQSEIYGEPAGDGGNMPSGPVEKTGTFFSRDDAGKITAMVPLTVEREYAIAGVKQWDVLLHDGTSYKMRFSQRLMVPQVMGDAMLIPTTWTWLPLGDTGSVELLDVDTAEVKEATVFLRGDGRTFDLQGPALAKVGSESFIPFERALFTLCAVGVRPEVAKEKLASAATGHRTVRVEGSRQLRPADVLVKSAASALKPVYDHINATNPGHLFKEAASAVDSTSVDAVLSLGFLNPNTVETFIAYLPDLDAAQYKLSELLLAARLGQKSLSQSSLERVVRSMEEVIEGLHVLAFSGG